MFKTEINEKCFCIVNMISSKYEYLQKIDLCTLSCVVNQVYVIMIINNQINMYLYVEKTGERFFFVTDSLTDSRLYGSSDNIKMD